MADEEYLPAKAPPSGAGQRLMAAREAAGLTLTQISAQTKIPVRMLTLIEAGNFAALPSRTYATGFTRSYARALGLDEADYVATVRREIGTSPQIEHDIAPSFETGDPARIPTAKFAWLAAIGALAVIAAGLLLWRTYYVPAVTLPPILPEETATAAVADLLPAIPDPLTPSGVLPSESAATGLSGTGLGTGLVTAPETRTATAPVAPRRVTGSRNNSASAPAAQTAPVPAMPQAEPAPVPTPASTAPN